MVHAHMLRIYPKAPQRARDYQPHGGKPSFVPSTIFWVFISNVGLQPAWTPSFLQIIQFQGTCCSLLLLGLDLNPLCSGIAEFSGFRSSLSKGCVFLTQVWRTYKPGREAGGPGRCLLSTVSRSWYTPCSAVNHHQPLLAKRLFTNPYPPVYFHSVFQFYWDRIDIQLRISLRCPASWLDTCAVKWVPQKCS